MIHRKTVTGPGPSAWTIRRRWASRPRSHWRLALLPWRRLGQRRGGPGWLGFPVGMGDGFIGWFLITFLIVGAFFFLAFIGWPIVVLLVDTFVIIPATYLAGVAARVMWGRPWTIEASSSSVRGEPRHVSWDVTGWRASSRAVGWMTASIRATGDLDETPPAALAPGPDRRVA